MATIYFPADIFLNENEQIAIKISQKFVPNGPINNGSKPLSEPIMTYFTDIYVSMS